MSYRIKKIIILVIFGVYSLFYRTNIEKQKEKKIYFRNQVKVDELNKNFEELNNNLNKYTSYWKVFLRGLVRGVSTVIGATIFAGIIISIIAKLLSQIDILDLPIWNDIVNKFQEIANTKE